MEQAIKQMLPIFMVLGNFSRSPVLNAVNTWAIFQEFVLLAKVEAKENPARGRDDQFAIDNRQ